MKSDYSVRTLLGRLIVSKGPVLNLTRGGIYIPDSGPGWKSDKKLPVIAFVHLHRDTRRFGECLTGRRIIVDKFAGQRFTLGGVEFYNIPESACLAVLEEGKRVTRNEFKKEVADKIDSVVTEDRELGQTDVDDIIDALSADDLQDMAQLDDDDSDEDDDEDDEAEEETPEETK